jgi:hypothetical protein
MTNKEGRDTNEVNEHPQQDLRNVQANERVADFLSNKKEGRGEVDVNIGGDRESNVASVRHETGDVLCGDLSGHD